MKDVDAMWDLLEDVFPTGGTEDMYKTDLAKASSTALFSR